MSSSNRKPNRLIHEPSPYLQQHAYNPVDWYPWSDEAFEKASREGKPIFLSIGYSTCHWCHVMEKESFEDEEVARLMNEAFVNIKVDREERPDIDQIYMTVAQMLTGTGGWPLTIVMTPDKKPFFAGTYFPRESRFGRMGMRELVPRLHKLWKEKKEEVFRSAEEITAALQQSQRRKGRHVLGKEILDQAAEELLRQFDPDCGGFGLAPKFPSPHLLIFLLHYAQRAKNSHALQAVETTLERMRLGGIYDHIGFGFHRYSTDRYWILPHFEKMLYDQAMITLAYLEAYQVTKKPLYARTAEETISYVLRDLTSKEGGFYSAEDADSEGEEGKFYLFTEKELKEVLGDSDAAFVIASFNVKPEGNFREEATGQKTGANILHLSHPVSEIARKLELPEDAWWEKWQTIRKKLFEARQKRTHPFKDDKILTDWNGLMMAALAQAAIVLNKPKYLDAACKAADFALAHLRTRDGKLHHRFRDGQAGITGKLDDYVFLAWGMLRLYEASFQTKYLKAAVELMEKAFALFWDNDQGGFFMTPKDGEKLIARPKEVYDGALPSGNSIAMMNLLLLGHYTGRDPWQALAEKLVEAFSPFIQRHPSAYAMLLTAYHFALSEVVQVVIAGESDQPETQKLLHTTREHNYPYKVVMLKTEKNKKELAKIAPFTEALFKLDNKPTAYVCRGHRCELPTTDPRKIIEFFDAMSNESKKKFSKWKRP